MNFKFLRGVRSKGGTLRDYFNTVRPLIGLAWKASPRFLVVSFGLTLLIGLLPTANIFITSALLEALVQATRRTDVNSLLPTNFVLLLVLLAGASLLTQILQRLSSVVQHLHQTHVINYIERLIAEKAVAIDLAHFENPTFHNQMRTAANDASYVPLMFVNQLMQTASMLVTVISLATILIIWQPWIVPVLIVTSLITLGVSMRFGTARVNLIKDRAETERQKQYLNMLFTSEQAAKEIRVFGLQDLLLGRFRKIQQTVYQQDRQLAFRELRYSGTAGVLLAGIQPALIAFTAFQTLAGIISIGQFNLYTQSIAQLEGGLTQLIFTLSSLHESNLFAASLFGFLSTQPQVEAKRAGSASRVGAISSAPRIEFQNVSFGYPGTNAKVLKNVNLEIKPGEAIALVGENGVGKSTLIKLLSGLYEPTEGKILLDGVDIQLLNRQDLRDYLSIIFQDYTIYHFSVRDNIGVGRTERFHSLEQIEEAAYHSGLDQVIAKLPNGYETILGRFWQDGHELSGGQRQLVALARALLRQSPILILDEPSAALDIYTENRFFERLLQNREAGQVQTIIFISHRFTTVRHANRILVLENGNILEQGTHEELISQNKRYAEMYNLQASQYQNNTSNVQRVAANGSFSAQAEQVYGNN